MLTLSLLSRLGSDRAALKLAGSGVRRVVTPVLFPGGQAGEPHIKVPSGSGRRGERISPERPSLAGGALKTKGSRSGTQYRGWRESYGSSSTVSGDRAETRAPSLPAMSVTAHGLRVSRVSGCFICGSGTVSVHALLSTGDRGLLGQRWGHRVRRPPPDTGPGSPTDPVPTGWTKACCRHEAAVSESPSFPLWRIW